MTILQLVCIVIFLEADSARREQNGSESTPVLQSTSGLLSHGLMQATFRSSNKQPPRPHENVQLN